jgi:NCS1 family nucleobase:cation symporter-1
MDDQDVDQPETGVEKILETRVGDNVTEGSSDAVFSGSMPTREGQVSLEMHGMAPIPLTARYGRLHRIFTVWFTPNLVPAGFFIGTLANASYIGVGFKLGLVAIIVGTVIGALPVSILGTWGPSTGLGQLPLARLPLTHFAECSDAENAL